MYQLSGSTQAALDYNSTIIGALELSEKKWVLAVQLPGVSRHSRHVLEACGDGLASFVERLKARCAAAGRKIAQVIAAQSDQQPTHADLRQHWAEAAIDAQLKGMKTSLRLTADQEKDWGSFESAVKDAEKARVTALQKEQSSGLTPMDRLNAKAERLAESQAGLEKIVEAAKP